MSIYIYIISLDPHYIPDKCIPTSNQNTCPGAIPSSSIARPTQGAGGAHHQGMHAARAGLVLFRGFPPDFSMGSSWKIQNYWWNMDIKKTWWIWHNLTMNNMLEIHHRFNGKNGWETCFKRGISSRDEIKLWIIHGQVRLYNYQMVHQKKHPRNSWLVSRSSIHTNFAEGEWHFGIFQIWSYVRDCERFNTQHRRPTLAS